MAAVLHSSAVVFLAVCVPVSLGVAMSPLEKQQRHVIAMVRSETRPHEELLAPAGQLIEKKLTPLDELTGDKLPSPLEDLLVGGSKMSPLEKQQRHVIALQGQRHHFQHARAWQETHLPALCNVNFPIGLPDQSNCTDPDHHHVIDSPALCEMAAEEARERSDDPHRNNTNMSTFLIGLTEQGSKPKGCFVEAQMYHYNPAALYPTVAVTGQPICYEPEFQTTNATADGSCPATFQIIMSEATCMEAARCLSACTEPHFEVTDANETLTLPSGCHFHPTTGCVQFNPETTAIVSGSNTSQICNTTIHYDKTLVG